MVIFFLLHFYLKLAIFFIFVSWCFKQIVGKMHKRFLFPSALLLLLSSSCNNNELYEKALQESRANARQIFVENLAEFNTYQGRPTSDGPINASNVEEFLVGKTPYFLCSNENFTKVYNYRWWMMSKHLREWRDTTKNKDCWVFTEFYGWPAHGSLSGAIPCPAGHQFYDLRWLREPKYLSSFIEYYMKGDAATRNQRENYAFHSNISRPESHHFSSWMIDGAEAFLKVHPNNEWRDMMLPHLERHQGVWDEKFMVHKEGARTDSMYKVLDLYDGMEFTISATMALIQSDGPYAPYTSEDWKEYYLGWGAIDKMRSSALNEHYPEAFARGYPLMYLVRPSINSYYYANLRSLSSLYGLSEVQGAEQKSEHYEKRAKNIQQRTMENLWNEEDKFFNTITAADNAYGVKDWEAKVRESAGYTPWYFNMVPQHNGIYDSAWNFLFSSEGFANKKGMSTAEISHPLYNEQAYAWNGRGWPFQNSVVNKAYANYLRNYKQSIDSTDRQRLYDLVEQVVALHGTEPNIGEWYIPSNGENFGGVMDYFHSSFVDMIIEDLIGFGASHKDEFTIEPLLPAQEWDYFYLGNILYHGHEIDIIWKRDWDAEKDGNQSRLCVWVDGKIVEHTAELNKKLTIKL